MAMISNLQLSTCFYASAANRNPYAADWSKETGILAFAANKSIALVKPLCQKLPGIRNLIKGHSAVINSVKFVRFKDVPYDILLTGASDGVLGLWKYTNKLENVAFIKGHDSSVITITALDSLIGTSGADSTVRLWKIDKLLNITLLQTIRLSTFNALALSLSHLPDSSSYILALGGSSNCVDLYTSPPDINFVQNVVAKGHMDWIRGLDFKFENGDLLLASASQDRYVRLWRVKREQETPKSLLELPSPESTFSTKAQYFNVNDSRYSFTFDALLIGHDDWVFTVSWRPGPELHLLTASADSSLICWSPHIQTGIWVCTDRLGEVSVSKGSTTATGSAGGLWGGLWGLGGKSVASWGRCGCWHMWINEGDRWMSIVAPTGHFKQVKGLSWEGKGQYLLTSSLDQTSRLWAPKDGFWYEMSRPQIHGYDINCISSISETQFASGADEKVIRVFDIPKGVLDLLQSVCGIRDIASDAAFTDAASVPVLGLSNKALSGNQPLVQSQLPLGHLKSPPIEAYLQKHTLWPEREKLYGHGYELITLSVSHDGKVIASSCKASSPDYAVLPLCSTKDFKETQPPLSGHSLTVTRIRFSTDDRYLLSVGRDRQWIVYERTAEGYVSKFIQSKAHARIIWDSAWAPADAGRVFVTGSRDKMVKVWQLGEKDVQLSASISFPESVTSLDFMPLVVSQNLILAVGLEDGQLFVVGCPVMNLSKWTPLWKSGTLNGHDDAINQLQWRPKIIPKDLNNWQLATVSDDFSVRIHNCILSF